MQTFAWIDGNEIKLNIFHMELNLLLLTEKKTGQLLYYFFRK